MGLSQAVFLCSMFYPTHEVLEVRVQGWGNDNLVQSLITALITANIAQQIYKGKGFSPDEFFPTYIP